MPSISYAITVCNEAEEIKRLLEKLLPIVRAEDEIIVQYDAEKVTQQVENTVAKITKSDKNTFSNIFITSCPLKKDFADFKNHIKELCKKDYIFFIDADEYPSDNLLHHLPVILESNPIDLFVVPRVNTVEGLTSEHIQKWGWRIDNSNRINWPDYQTRIVRNHSEFQWSGKVHEKIVGWKTTANFPADTEDWALYHPKIIDRQERQNEFYNTI